MTMFSALLGFAMWAVLLMLCLVSWRITLVAQKKFAINAFPATEKHGPDMYWRLVRAQGNTVENLGIFAAIVLVGYATGGTTADLDQIAKVILLARIAQSLIHISSGSALAVNLRATAFVVQIVGFIMMAWSIAGRAGML